MNEFNESDGSLYTVDSIVLQWMDWRHLNSTKFHYPYKEGNLFVTLTKEEFSDFFKFKDAILSLQSPHDSRCYLIPECSLLEYYFEKFRNEPFDKLTRYGKRYRQIPIVVINNMAAWIMTLTNN